MNIWRYMPWILVAVLFVLLVISAYRVFDMGVTTTYMEGDLDTSHQLVESLVEFQRSNCESINGSPGKDWIFKQDGFIIIAGFRFECRASEDGKNKLFYVK